MQIGATTGVSSALADFRLSSFNIIVWGRLEEDQPRYHQTKKLILWPELFFSQTSVDSAELKMQNCWDMPS